MGYYQRQTDSDLPFAKSAATVLVFLIFAALSFLTNDYMTSMGYGAWEQVAIPLAVEWLAFVGLMKLMWAES